MSKFGQLKTNIEKTSIGLFGKNEFGKFMNEFKSNILENRDLSEIFYIYDDLSSKKGLDRDIADEYVNESIEYCQILIENNKSKLSKLNEWILSYTDETNNSYKNIDTVVYNNSIKYLENVLESKKQIISNLISEEVKKEIKESVNLPLSTIVKVAEDNLKNELSSLSESDKKELTSISSLSKEELETEFNTLKESVISNLKGSLNESKEDDIKTMIGETITKISDSKCTHYDLYKLRKLQQGL
jgi:F0F1-type ATP synthase membrane subunit b/b'